MEQEIDFAVTWVDGSDPAWRRERARFSGETDMDDGECRYRDWGLLRYWFRGVEKFAPWVRRVHFITWGHLPPWLNTEHPKLRIVRHEDYIPREYLPTFNSNVLEIYMDRIPGLAEHFVYFNDDVLLINAVRPSQFFRDGKPCDLLTLQPVAVQASEPVMPHVCINDMLLLSKYFDKRETIRKRPWAFFNPRYPLKYNLYNLLELCIPNYTGIWSIHCPFPLCRSTIQEFWVREGEQLTAMSGNRFRSKQDVTLRLFREWQKLSGNFCPTNLQKAFSYFAIGPQNEKLLQTIRRQKKRMVCINDVPGELDDVPRVREEIQKALQHILPEASSFERL